MKDKPKTHKVKGTIHPNTKDKCILCNKSNIAVIGEKTGGKW